MSKGKQPDFVPGDLVRVEIEETPGWPLPSKKYLALVVEVETCHLPISRWAAGRVPVRNVNRPTKVNWVMPRRLELVQRGGQ